MQNISFIFNQLIFPKIVSGGDFKSFEMVQHFKASKYHVEVIAPEVSRECFANIKFVPTGKYRLDKFIIRPSHLSTYFICYLLRTIETIILMNGKHYDVVYTTGDFFCNVIPAFVAANRINIWAACIYHLNDPPHKRRNNFCYSLVSYLLQRFSLLLIRQRADCIFVLNEGIKLDLIEMGFTNPIIVSQAGLDVRAEKKRIGQHSQNRKGLVFCNRVNPTKGVDDLPEILSKVNNIYPSTRLEIIGSYSEKTKRPMDELFKKYNCLDQVIFHGYVNDKKDVYKIIKSAKVFLQPSYEEGWSIVLFEAILCGTIPVVYDLPVYREIFNNWLPTAPLGDKVKLAGKVLEILALPQAEYKKLSNTLYQIAEKYDWDDVYKIEEATLLELSYKD